MVAVERLDRCYIVLMNRKRHLLSASDFILNVR
jgi:hypothetical protein